MATVSSRFLRYIEAEPMTGPDVLWVQERLRELGVYAGPLNSTYDRPTYDSVIAFQAQQGLDPDGIVGPLTYTALGSPATPPSNAWASITVDLEQRRLFLDRRGATRRVYSVAVGAPSTPTPVGRWVIVQKALDPGGPFGTRWMRLNIPWGGYGIHGTDDPESIGRAVSHGCIRMRNPAVEQLYSLVTVGTPVNIVGQVFTGRMLFQGMDGADVRLVQEILQDLGFFGGVVDGVFGDSTLVAVRAFQRDQGLTPDGIVGPLTYDRLQQALDMSRENTEP